MIHPHTEIRFISEEMGYGLFATRTIPRGTITWTLDRLDRVIPPAELQDYPPIYREILLKYSFRNSRGDFIFCWDNGRYINHSFNANCCLTPYNFEIAIRDIEEGEEVTDDYGYLNIIEPFEVPGETGERRIVYPDDLLRYAENWDSSMHNAFPLIWEQEQLLWQYLRRNTLDALQKIRRGDSEILSIACCYYDARRQQGKKQDAQTPIAI